MLWLQFSSAKVVDKVVADRHVVDGRVADECVADGRVFCNKTLERNRDLHWGP
jgi:hypothetical protein